MAPLTVLVVDDDPDITASLRMMLEAMGHDCREAHDGVSALDCVRVYAPDVVLLDLNLPGVSGFSVAERVRQLPGGGEVTIVAITGNASSRVIDRTLMSGFDGLWLKPIDLETIRATFGVAQPGSRPGRRQSA